LPLARRNAGQGHLLYLMTMHEQIIFVARFMTRTAK
jgi:hypothetical protein